jgi:ribosomal-protein-alanine N-acetyltransferase
MCRGDLRQVNEIDREAFPTQWPPPDYRRELQNPLARLLVVCDDRHRAEAPEKDLPQEEATGLMAVIKRWWRRNRFFGDRPPDANGQYIIGFASIWVMADEVHITNIAVRKDYQRQGIGELLLISIMSLGAELKADIVTLEVRVSNLPAQRLYHKYGFAQVGLRHGYYTDNREDALLMSTGNITSAPFQAQFRKLKRAYAQKYGEEVEPLSNIAARESVA